jgi:hypothetical protein
VVLIMISGTVWVATEMEAAVDELRSVPTAASHKLMASNVMGDGCQSVIAAIIYTAIIYTAIIYTPG